MIDAPLTAGPKQKSKWGPLLLGLVLAVFMGGAGFYATWSGWIAGFFVAEHAEVAALPLPDIAFVPVDPVVISLGPAASSRHLRFTAQLEVSSAHADEVKAMMPRVLDVLNSYLRAVAVTDLEEPSAMARLRAQMLRRVQIVTGEGRVRDLLVIEFVLN